jgi:hypothetical protein
MSSSQDTTVSDTLAVVMALKRHLKEDNCKHSIKSILREGLKSKAVAPPQDQQPTQAATTIPTPTRMLEYDRD